LETTKDLTGDYRLAQVNIGRIVAPMDSQEMHGFASNLDFINGQAEQSQGFIWRLTGDDNNATSIKIFDDDLVIINMSVWDSVDALYKFTYSADHLAMLKRRREWFSKFNGAFFAMWYVHKDQMPTAADALLRISYIAKYGDTPHAFGFKHRFTVQQFLDSDPLN
jgi:hypothetical protein